MTIRPRAYEEPRKKYVGIQGVGGGAQGALGGVGEALSGPGQVALGLC